jgi:hypothetical protein
VVKIRVDAADMTLAEHAEAAQIAAENGHPTDGPGAQFYSVAAMAYLVHKRVDPTFTYAQALNLKMSELDLVNEDEGGEAAPEAIAASNGGAPQTSPVSGP